MKSSVSAAVIAKPVKTTCPYCGVGCGVLATPSGDGTAGIAGDPDHPANFGRLCSKGSALGETLSLDGRLLHPKIRDAAGVMQRVNWYTALDRVAEGFRSVIDRHGPDAVALYVSGQLLTEDYYVANKLMKGFIGSANIDTNSRLCMASSVAGHKRAFGSDTVPGCYGDLDQADLLVLVGSNAAWCHPILHQRMVANRARRGAKIVVIDPRETPTAGDGDLVLQIAPGMDGVLFSGLLVHLSETQARDDAFIAASTTGFDQALARAREIAPDLATVARRCGLSEADVTTFYDWFATTPNTVTLYSQGVNQSAQGTDKVNAIINCHLATGRIGAAGQGPFSLTGQPNAMGGREVGGLANQLAAHMGFDELSLDRVQRFWHAPNIARREGLKAVDLFAAIAEGRIKALWIMGTNPAASMPQADAVIAGLAGLEHFVVSDVVACTDTILSGADVLLPAAGWGEKDGTVTNSERRISRQRAFLAPPGDARPDWWIVCEVAKRLGFASAFDYRSAADVFREHAELTGFENGGTRDLDLTGLHQINQRAYDMLDPVQWPVTVDDTSTPRVLSDGRFFTDDGRARFIAIEVPKLAGTTTDRYPLRLNTGRIRDQWHTMTRTGKSPRLGAHIEEPYVDISSADATRYGVEDGGLARLTTEYGTARLRVHIRSSQRTGEVFAPIHWTGTTSSDGRIGALVSPAADPFSGQPELKATACAIGREPISMDGFLITQTPINSFDGVWWSRVALMGGAGYRIAGAMPFEAWPALAARMLGTPSAELLVYEDASRQIYRAAALSNGALVACLFMGAARRDIPEWDWLKHQIGIATDGNVARKSLLAGRRPDGAIAEGPVVCACFAVGLSVITGAVCAGTARTVEEIGISLKAGTNCGSCIPELKRIIAATPAATVAA